MIYETALAIANEVKRELTPYCSRIEVAGSIRRQNPDCKDIEIVLVVKKADIRDVIRKWPKIKGDIPLGKYTQRRHPRGVVLDIFTANDLNFGMIYAIRTGSANYSKKIMIQCGKNGVYCEGGFLRNLSTHDIIPVYTERDFFNTIRLPYLDPKERI